VNSVRFRHDSDRTWPKVTVKMNVKIQSTGMCYNTILVVPVHAGWYLSMRFLHTYKRPYLL
jgi:hypothetical protein